VIGVEAARKWRKMRRSRASQRACVASCSVLSENALSQALIGATILAIFRALACKLESLKGSAARAECDAQSHLDRGRKAQHSSASRIATADYKGASSIPRRMRSPSPLPSTNSMPCAGVSRLVANQGEPGRPARSTGLPQAPPPADFLQPAPPPLAARGLSAVFRKMHFHPL
jgi:hypothetical protein